VTRSVRTGLLLPAFPAGTLADWTVIPLHPAGAYSTAVAGVTAQQQVGSWQATSFSLTKPVIWTGSSASMVSLAPGSTEFGVLNGVSGDAQFGQFGSAALGARAAIWHGTPQSRVDLDPSGPLFSTVNGLFGAQQVGVRGAQAGGGHATLWQGSPGSMVDLHPAGALDSNAYCTDGIHQGGYVQSLSGGAHAALWSGSASSDIDLNPTAASGSKIFGMASGQQVGFATFGVPGVDHAVMWSGSAASWTDLNPPNSSSELTATCGTAQVGVLNGFDAAVWFGTAGSVVDLHSLLPQTYAYSVADSVYETNGTYYVGGWAHRNGGPSQEAFLWVGVPAPSGLAALSMAGVIGYGNPKRA
jgi:hypothetical protein